jgi:uncharacterized protein
MAEREENQSREDQPGRGFDSMDNQQQQENLRTENESSDNGRGTSDHSGRRSNRGFAAMDPDKQKEIASEGGRAAHRQGVAHEWSSDEAREAGRKGGQIVSRNREHMSEIGRRGGQSSGSRRSQKNEGGERQ